MWNLMDSTYIYSNWTRNKCNIGPHAAVIYDNHVNSPGLTLVNVKNHKLQPIKHKRNVVDAIASRAETTTAKRQMDASGSTDSIESTFILDHKRNSKIPELTNQSVDKLFKLACRHLNGRVPKSKMFLPNLFAARKIKDAKLSPPPSLDNSQQPDASSLPSIDWHVPKRSITAG